MDYKQKYFNLLKSLRKIESNMRLERCPPAIFRKCCGGCNVLKKKIKEIKDEEIENYSN